MHRFNKNTYKNVTFILLISLFVVSYNLRSRITENNLCHLTFSKLDELFESSENQRLIKKETLVQTLRFMLEEVDPEDPELVAFVKTLIVFPSNEERNLDDKSRKDFSQIGQSKYMDSLLNSKRNGFFIEAGGHNGEANSNSLFFELTRNWTGLLIEPVPSFFQQLSSKKRKVFAINACIANSRPLIAKFQQFRGLSGRVKTMNDKHVKRIDFDSNNAARNYLYVPCFPLVTILKAINVNYVDYFSLDVEGGEIDVLKGIDYKKLNIKSFTIEHNGNLNEKNMMIEHLTKFNYTTVKDDEQDIYLIKLQG